MLSATAAPTPTQLPHSPVPQASELPRAKSLPANLEAYVPTPTRRKPLAQAAQAFTDLLMQAQRPLTPEDHRRARKDPVCRDKKLVDVGSLGATTLHRRATRHSREGRMGRARTERVAGVVAMVPMVADLLPNAAAYGGRWLVQKVVGAPYFSARTEGGVREDRVLEAMLTLSIRYRAAPDWIFADRDPEVALRPEEIYGVIQAATQAEAGLRDYVAKHPEARIRHSGFLEDGFSLLYGDLRIFQSKMLDYAFALRPMPCPPAQERVEAPQLESRHWADLDRLTNLTCMH